MRKGGVKLKPFSEPGKISDTILMLDAYGWKTSKTTSSYVILGEKVALIEPAHRSSAEKVVEGLKNFNVNLNKVFYILVSHRHFDHSAGGPSLLKYLPNAVIGAHLYRMESLEKMLNYDLEIVSFAHFGGVIGKDVNEVIRLAIETLEDWKSIAENVWETSKDISDLAKKLGEKYQEKLEVFPKQVRGFIFQILATGLANSLFQRK